MACAGQRRLGNQVDTLFGAPFDLLLGRRTYEISAAYWPFVPAEDRIYTLFNRAPKYVLSRAGVELSWEHSERLRSLADCAAAPSLFYADWVDPIPEAMTNLKACRARLLARPSVARTADEARPYRPCFPLGAPDRD